MPFDPNGAVFFNGRYHVGYIYQNEGKHYWGHVSSDDLIHWRGHPPMLSPGPEIGIFSGNSFVDKQGRVVLSYHGLADPAEGYEAGNCLAIAEDDDLNHFHKLPQNPVMKNPGWDPHTWVENNRYYSISGGNPSIGGTAVVYSATDESLTQWQLIGPLMAREMPDVEPLEDISCPDLFTLGEKHILLCISHMRGARYYIGHFDGEQFHPESHHRMNWPGGACFAPETLLDDHGRRIMWAWALGSPSTMTLPRVLSMGADGGLMIAPAEELQSLRKNERALIDVTVAADSEVDAKGFEGAHIWLHIKIDPMLSAECGLKVRRSPNGEEETAIIYDARRNVLRIETERSSLDRSTLPREYAMTFMLPAGADDPIVSCQEAPFILEKGERLELHIFLDGSILEVFANSRQCLTQRLRPTREDSVGVSFIARGGNVEVVSLLKWDMDPITVD